MIIINLLCTLPSPPIKSVGPLTQITSGPYYLQSHTNTISTFPYKKIKTNSTVCTVKHPFPYVVIYCNLFAPGSHYLYPLDRIVGSHYRSQFTSSPFRGSHITPKQPRTVPTRPRTVPHSPAGLVQYIGRPLQRPVTCVHL